MTRILTALVGIPLLFHVIKHRHPAWFLGLVLVAAAVGAWELYSIAEQAGHKPYKLIGTALSAAVAYTFFFDARLGAVDILCAAAIIVPLAALARTGSGLAPLHHAPGSIGVTFLPILFVGLLMGFSLRLIRDGGELGRDLTVLLFWVVWLADAGAYMVGSLFGRRRLMPRISPGKTVEGAIGAILVALAASLVAKAWFFTRLELRDAVALGLLLGAAGMLGDLAESMLKRSAGIKDSGVLFPGHGGMLDRTDSLLFAAPVLFYYHSFFMA